MLDGIWAALSPLIIVIRATENGIRRAQRYHSNCMRNQCEKSESEAIFKRRLPHERESHFNRQMGEIPFHVLFRLVKCVRARSPPVCVRARARFVPELENNGRTRLEPDQRPAKIRAMQASRDRVLRADAVECLLLHEICAVLSKHRPRRIPW